ncbi:DUF2314 domain-containing protein [Pseudogemmobacter bohemicus]|uniref:DUF2314 domain-containing protein n=1 Tax=Pseudogemmobacter bohemicus TaxID=2250708 RepID=UPI000DD30940|nr:DUF2314 domain-containing protein [Pseudogemmobacter bohemicus]
MASADPFRIASAFLLGLVLSSGAFTGALRAETAKAMDFARADPAMNAAIDAARATLPEFLAKAAAADLSSGDYRVKWARPTDEGNAATEHIWVVLTSVDPESVEGTLASRPETFRGASGDAVRFAQSEISDWMLFRADGLIEGCYTTRVMLARMNEQDRESYEAQLAPLPATGTSTGKSTGADRKISAGN